MDVSVKARWILLSVILILFLSLEDSRAGGIPSFCDIPPVKEGGNATLTCTFTEDISVTKSDFEIDQIDRYSPTNFKQETLLVCAWNIDEPKCYLNPRITFDPVITNTLQIQILNVKSIDAGKYICYILPTPNGISKSCSLTLEETTFSSETYAPRNQLSRSSDVPMIDISTTIQDSKEDGGMSPSIIGIIFAAIIAIFILQGILCFVVFKCLKRHLGGGSNGDVNPAKNINNKPTNGEENANQELLDKSTNNEGSMHMTSMNTSSSDDDLPPVPDFRVGLSDRESYILPFDQYNYKGESMVSLTRSTSDDTLSIDSEIVLRDDQYKNADEMVGMFTRFSRDYFPSLDSGIGQSDDEYENADEMDQYGNADEIVGTLSMTTSFSDYDSPPTSDSGIGLCDYQHGNANEIVGTLSLSTSYSDYDDHLSLDSGIGQSDDPYEKAHKIVGTISLIKSFKCYDRPPSPELGIGLSSQYSRLLDSC